jgi:uncharacterized membrane protein
MNSSTPSRIISRWDLAALGGIAALGLLYVRILPLLPDPVPTHFDALGRVNGWTSKDTLPYLVFGAPALLWTVLFVIGAVAALLPGGGQRGVPGTIHALRGLLGLGLCLLMAGCLLVPLQGQTALFSGLLAFAVCLVLGIVFTVRDTWQALAQAPRSEHYRSGGFYVNPDDPRVWVPKRVGVGWTLNYGRPGAYLVTLLLVACMVGLGLAVQAAVRH